MPRNSSNSQSSQASQEPGPVIDFVITQVKAPEPGAGFAEVIKGIETLLALPDYQEACDFALDLAGQSREDGVSIDAEADDAKPLEACEPGWYLRWIRKDEEPAENDLDVEDEPRAELGVYRLTPGVFSGVYVTLTEAYLITPVEVPDEDDLEGGGSDDEDFDPSSSD